ncbi:Hypothetical protein R9X50_00086600 [Acrodontium crateriforme]|uniref:Low temperature requirement A n=1 Tax=Acrodontium crateriforme TaxID=150365 RepID=A0AAQ3R7D4_9PEZI|nr:Hypothetical protein R9X50_00086600 [Acrodontium crateriforme]
MSSTPSDSLPGGLTFADSASHKSGGQATPHGHHFAARTRERLRHFLHPDGRKIHVASSPEEVAVLRAQLEPLHRDQPFDVLISGTPEHLNALREAQTHHEDRRRSLEERHGDVYNQFATVHDELDALSSELDRVTSHGVSLEAHFSRFGYNAHIRSYDDETPTASGSTTPRAPSLHESKKESAAERGFATSLKLIKKPVVRQYFHKGILWRSSGGEEVQSFELFVDLLYVGILAINGDATSERPDGLALLQFVITFTLSFKIWNDMALIISWFETDDLFQRLSILILLALLFGYTTNITHAFDTGEEGNTYATAIGFYLAARLFMAFYLFGVGIVLKMIRPVMFWHTLVAVIACAFWIGSIYVEWPNQLILIWIALFFDIVGQVSYVFLMVICHKLGPKSKDWFDNTFEFYPAINIEHRTERMRAFVSLVFGYTVVAILYQSTTNGIDAFYGKAVLGLVQAFCFNWLYFEIDDANLIVHAIRRHKLSAFAWSMAHLPFIMAFVLAGGALARLVLAHDTPSAHFAALSETYQGKSEPDVPAGIRWFYCGGLGVALLCMSAISLSHVHKETKGIRLQKRWRLAGRVAIAGIIVCLPIAGDKLSSLKLVGIVTALIVLVLSQELWAVSCKYETLFDRSKPCQYVGMCEKKKFDEMVREGKAVDIEALSSEKIKNSGITIGP